MSKVGLVDGTSKDKRFKGLTEVVGASCFATSGFLVSSFFGAPPRLPVELWRLNELFLPPPPPPPPRPPPPRPPPPPLVVRLARGGRFSPGALPSDVLRLQLVSSRALPPPNMLEELDGLSSPFLPSDSPVLVRGCSFKLGLCPPPSEALLF